MVAVFAVFGCLVWPGDGLRLPWQPCGPSGVEGVRARVSLGFCLMGLLVAALVLVLLPPSSAVVWMSP